MQINFSELANEALNVNSKLFNKSVELGVERAQELIQGTSEKTGEWLKVKTFDEYVETQNTWNAFAVDQIQQSTRSAIDFGTEAYNSYFGLWEKFNKAATENAVVKVEAKPVATKK